VVYFRIVGGNDPFKLVMSLCGKNGWTSYTPENELFLDSNLDTLKYWQGYKTYKGIINDVFYKKTRPTDLTDYGQHQISKTKADEHHLNILSLMNDRTEVKQQEH
jgi:hypothetical protein